MAFVAYKVSKWTTPHLLQLFAMHFNTLSIVKYMLIFIFYFFLRGREREKGMTVEGGVGILGTAEGYVGTGAI